MFNSAIQIQPGEQGEQGASADRNRIINGQFDIWQRETSFSPLNDLYTADRWITVNQSSGFGAITWNVNRVSFSFGQILVPEQPEFYLDYQGFTVGGTGTEAFNIHQRIEGSETLAGKTVTVSFYAKGNPAGTVHLNIAQGFENPAVGPEPPVEQQSVAINLTNTFQRFVVQFNLPPVTGKVTSGVHSLRLRWWTQTGPNYAAIAPTVGPFINNGNPFTYSGVMSLANVQLEEGDIASQFEKKLPNDELIRCQRYYQKSYQQGVFAGAGLPVSTERRGEIYIDSDSNFSGAFSHSFATSMRASPTISVFSSAGVPNQAFDIIGQTVDLNLSGLGETGFSGGWFNQQPPSGSPLSYSYHYTADAEII